MERAWGLGSVDEQYHCDGNEQQLSYAYMTLIQVACQACNKLNDIIGGKHRKERLKDRHSSGVKGGEEMPYLLQLPFPIPDWKTVNRLTVM